MSMTFQFSFEYFLNSFITTNAGHAERSEASRVQRYPKPLQRLDYYHLRDASLRAA